MTLYMELPSLWFVSSQHMPVFVSRVYEKLCHTVRCDKAVVSVIRYTCVFSIVFRPFVTNLV